MDSAEGRLTRVGDASTTGQPGALTTDSKRRCAFVLLGSRCQGSWCAPRRLKSARSRGWLWLRDCRV